MTIEEIRKNAPIGATHYRMIFFSPLYYKVDNSVAYQYISNHHDWVRFNVNIYELKPL